MTLDLLILFIFVAVLGYFIGSKLDSLDREDKFVVHDLELKALKRTHERQEVGSLRWK